MVKKKAAKAKKAPLKLAPRHIWPLLVFLIPCYLHTIYLLNAFYHFGAVFHDAGWLANTVWRNGMALMNPLQYGNYSILAIHLYLIFYPLTLLSYLLPLGMPEFYALLNGSIYAGFALLVFFALETVRKPKYPKERGWYALTAVLFAFGGIVMQGAWMTHIEYAIPLGIIAYFFFRGLQKPRLALAAFIFTLSIREDAGFHLAAPLILLTMIGYAKTRNLKAIRRDLILIAIACGYGLCAWGISHLLRSGSDAPHSLFMLTYMGNPPYAHLTWELLAERLQVMAGERAYLWLAALLSLGWAACTRNPYLAVGFVAYIPWFLMNWTATLENTGILYAYYAYPFMVSAAWPVLAALWQYGPKVPQAVARETVLLQVLVVACGLVIWDNVNHRLAFSPHYWSQWGSHTPEQGLKHRETVRLFVEDLQNGTAGLGETMLDSGMLSLAAHPVHGRALHSYTGDKAIDSFVYFNPFFVAPQASVAGQVKKHRLARHYCLAGTGICVFSNRAPETIAGSSPALSPVDVPDR